MKRLIVLILLACATAGMANAQTAKQQRKKNLVVKEMNLKAGSNTQYLDNQKTYDSLGRKVEEIEYASYGQKKRTTYEYDGTSKRCIKEVEYNEKNKVSRVKKFEYNADGTRAKQYNYSPNGKLQSTKVFEYSYN